MDLLDELVRFSNLYGSDKNLVLAGGGNTSAKSDSILYVKASGHSLAGIDKNGFAKMNLSSVREIFAKEYPFEDKTREAQALEDLMAARAAGEEKRPSVETSLHALFPQTFVLHLHPATVNGLACSVKGKSFADEIFGDEYIWVDSCKPGYSLAKLCSSLVSDFEKRKGKAPQIILLQNHGIFFAGDSLAELDKLLFDTIKAIKSKIKEEAEIGEEGIAGIRSQEVLGTLKSVDEPFESAIFCSNALSRRFTASKKAAKPMMRPFTPDHIVYCGAHPLFIEADDDAAKKYKEYIKLFKTKPKIVMVESEGFWALGDSEKSALNARDLFLDAMKIAVYSESFGGPLHMEPDLVDFIVNWEAESYRQKQN
ncbi:MAG TPA: class II aldolase/adducin family protein [Oscillospiraceae bacterium]|nr:class II aldolase/adducin family protein [Oscillospiraceae bacterium]